MCWQIGSGGEKSVSKTIKVQLMIFVILISVIPGIVLGALITPLFWNLATSRAEDAIQTAMELQSSNLESFISEVSDTAFFTSVDENVIAASKGATDERLAKAKELLEDKKKLLYFIDNSMILDSSGEFIQGTGSKTDALVTAQHMESIFTPIKNGAQYTFCVVPDSAKRKRIYLTVPIISEGETTGYVVESISNVFFSELFYQYSSANNQLKDIKFAFVDSRGAFFSENYSNEYIELYEIPEYPEFMKKMEKIFTSGRNKGKVNFKINSENYYGAYTMLHDNEIMAISIVPMETMNASAVTHVHGVMIIAVVFSAILAAIMLLLTRKYIDTINNVFTGIERIEAEKGNSPKKMSFRDKVNFFKKGLNDIIEQVNSHDDEISEMQSKYTNMLKSAKDLSFEYNPYTQELKLYIPNGYGDKKSRRLIIDENTQFADLIPEEEVTRIKDLAIRCAKVPNSSLSTPVKMKLYEGILTEVIMRCTSAQDKTDTAKMVGAIIDIERSQATERRIEKLETKYRFALDESADIIYEMNFITNKTIVNENLWYEYFDVPLIGGCLDIARAYRERVATEFLSDYDRMILDSNYLFSSANKRTALDYQVRNKDGNYIWVTQTVYVTATDGNKIIEVISCISNSNERKKREMEEMKQTRIDQATRSYNARTTAVEFTKMLMTIPDYSHAMIMVEVDDYNEIVQKYDRKVLDGALRRVVRVLWQYQHGGFAGRIEKNLFILCLPNIEEPDLVEESCSNILHELNRTVVIEGASLSIKVSIGVAVYPEHGISYDKLYVHSASALEVAKENGRNQFVIYDKDTMK